jgi:hypothetical protein
MDNLPTEILFIIGLYLDPQSFGRYLSINRRFKSLDCPTIWTQKFKIDYPDKVPRSGEPRLSYILNYLRQSENYIFNYKIFKLAKDVEYQQLGIVKNSIKKRQREIRDFYDANQLREIERHQILVIRSVLESFQPIYIEIVTDSIPLVSNLYSPEYIRRDLILSTGSNEIHNGMLIGYREPYRSDPSRVVFISIGLDIKLNPNITFEIDQQPPRALKLIASYLEWSATRLSRRYGIYFSDFDRKDYSIEDLYRYFRYGF